MTKKAKVTRHLLTPVIWDAIQAGIDENGLRNDDGSAKEQAIADRAHEKTGRKVSRQVVHRVMKHPPTGKSTSRWVRSEFLVDILLAVGKPGYLVSGLTDVEVAILESLRGLDLLPPEEQKRLLAETTERLQDKLAARGKKIPGSLNDG